MDQGILATKDIPDDFPLNERRVIQVACEKSGRPHVRPEKNEAFFSSLKYPLYFLDFDLSIIDLARLDHEGRVTVPRSRETLGRN